MGLIPFTQLKDNFPKPKNIKTNMTYTIKANLTDKHEYTQIIPSIFGISDLASMLVLCCLCLSTLGIGGLT